MRHAAAIKNRADECLSPASTYGPQIINPFEDLPQDAQQSE